MEFNQVIELRRTIRDFSTKEVPFEIIQRSLEAGIKAPSYNHLREWDFIMVNEPKLRLALTQTEEMIEEVSKDLIKAFDDYERVAREMYLEAIPKQKRMILEAPELLIVVYKPKTQVFDSKRIYDLNCLASIWCCIENILLSMADNNVFGVTFIPKNTDAVKAILNIPKELEVAAIIPFGYKAENSKVINQKDIDLNTRVHFDRW
ncbi:MAG: Nitroreductase [uncultured bacterium (gcode 4)]|uniref:Nitroreductase n=1 Tax=uncultured bacterium (gcode 4) TaxID=1234023 RepID=K2G8G2_9BACT|nr:MAG: Nitroreductase [uncultured bacterium (gcode 4)]